MSLVSPILIAFDAPSAAVPNIIAFALALVSLIGLWYFPKLDRIIYGVKRSSRGEATLKVLIGLSLAWALHNVISAFSSLGQHALDMLALLGVVIAAISWKEANDQNAEVKEILVSLPTRYIRSFPDHLTDVVKLISEAKKSIRMLVDCADHGSFSSPADHENVVLAIRAVCEENAKKKAKRQKEVAVEIRICGEVQVISRTSEFWEKWISSANSQEEWKTLRDKDQTFKRRLKAFCKFEVNKEIMESFDWKTCLRTDFINLMKRKHKQVEDRLSGVIIKSLENLEHMPGVFFCLKDGEEAVFFLSHTGPGTQEMAFFTRDPRILDILNRTWKNVWAANKVGEEKKDEFERKQNIGNFAKLYPNVKREHIDKVIKYDERRWIFKTLRMVGRWIRGRTK